jgi:hypothetical protein
VRRKTMHLHHSCNNHCYLCYYSDTFVGEAVDYVSILLTDRTRRRTMVRGGGRRGDGGDEDGGPINMYKAEGEDEEIRKVVRKRRKASGVSSVSH